MKVRLVLSAAIATLMVVAVRGQQPVGSRPSFRFERPVVTDGAGPRRLAIDVPLLAAAAPFRTALRATAASTTDARRLALGDGLRDLRFYDATGREIGYLLVSAPAAEPAYHRATLLPVPPVESKTVKTSGFEADLGEAATVDRFRVDGVAAPFLKRVRLEGSGDRVHWTTLVADGTLFDLPAERLQQKELRFARGPYRFLRLTWDDSTSARVTGTVSASAATPPASSPRPLTASVPFERRASEPGRSRFRVRLPAGHLPIVAIELDAAGNHILREARVLQAQLTDGQLTPVRLGAATLRRVEQGDAVASSMRIPIDPPSEAQLDLEVDDGDNPPLELRSVTAIFAELPWIYLEAPATGLVARYGNATLTAPRYDIEAVRDRLHIESVADASWGDARPSAAESSAAPASSPVATVGASLDVSLFKYVRALAAGPNGLVAVALDANALAHSGGPGRQFADVRVVDPTNHQVPYVVEQMPEPLSLDLALEPSAAPKTLPPARSVRSTYRVTYPVEGLPAARLVLTTTARVFKRSISIGEEREPDGRTRREPWFETLATAQWIHDDQDREAAPLTLSVPPLHGRVIHVVVDEGDNAPIPLGRARLLLPSYRVRLFRNDASPLRVVYGRRDLTRPEYDLSLLAGQVLGTAAADVALAPEGSPSADTSTAAVMSPRVFWAVLSVAVAGLLIVLARLLKTAPQT